MEEHTSFRRGGQADRGGEGCEDGRGDGVLLSDGQHPPPWDQPQQLQVSLPSPSTHPSPKKSESKTCSFLHCKHKIFRHCGVERRMEETEVSFSFYSDFQ